MSHTKHPLLKSVRGDDLPSPRRFRRMEVSARANGHGQLKLAEVRNHPLPETTPDNYEVFPKRDRTSAPRKDCDARHQWISNAGKRWLAKQKGRPWALVRPAFLEHLKNDHYLLQRLVTESSTMKNGKLVLQPMGQDPYFYESGYFHGIAYVDPSGILQVPPKKRYRYNSPEKKYFMVKYGYIWYVTTSNLIYRIPQNKVGDRKPDEHGRMIYGNTEPVINYGHLYCGTSKTTCPSLRGKQAPTCAARQVKRSSAPEGILDLDRIHLPDKKAAA